MGGNALQTDYKTFRVTNGQTLNDRFSHKTKEVKNWESLSIQIIISHYFKLIVESE